MNSSQENVRSMDGKQPKNWIQIIVTTIQLLILLLGSMYVFYLNHVFIYYFGELSNRDDWNSGYIHRLEILSFIVGGLFTLQFANLAALTFPYKKSYLWRLVIIVTTIALGLLSDSYIPGVDVIM